MNKLAAIDVCPRLNTAKVGYDSIDTGSLNLYSLLRLEGVAIIENAILKGVESRVKRANAGT